MALKPTINSSSSQGDNIKILVEFGLDEKSAAEVAKQAEDYFNGNVRHMKEEAALAASNAAAQIRLAKEAAVERQRIREKEIADIQKAAEKGAMLAEEAMRKRQINFDFGEGFEQERKQREEQAKKIADAKKKEEEEAVAYAKNLWEEADKERLDNERAIAEERLEAQTRIENLLAQKKKRVDEEVAKAEIELQQAVAEEKKRLDAEVASKARAEARKLLEEQRGAYRQQLANLSNLAQQASVVSRNIAFVSSGFLASAFAIAKRYIDKTEDRTQLTERWEKAGERIEKAETRIGRALAKEFLPALEKGADIVEKLADFIEQNPEVVKAGVQGLAAIAGIATTVSVLANVVALISRVAMTLDKVSAMTTAGRAATHAGTMLFAPAGGAVQAGTAGSLATVIATKVVPALLTLASVVGGVVAGMKIYDKYIRKEGESSAGTIFKQTGASAAAGWLLIFEKLGLASEKNRASNWEAIKSFFGLSEAAENASSSLDEASSSLGRLKGSAHEAEIVNAFIDLMNEEKRAAEEYAVNRQKILADARKADAQIGNALASAISSIRASYGKQISGITSNYQTELKRSEEQYYAERTKVARDGGEEIRRIEEEHQENMRKLLQEHNERVDGLVRSRDALGLKKEMRDYEKQRQEADRATSREIAQRRRDIAIRLQDMAQAHAAERKQRLEDYQRQMAEAKLQMEERIKEAQKQAAEQRRANQEATAEQLRQLRDNYQREIQMRRDAFIQQIRNLDAALLGEQKIRERYYQIMLQRAQAFIDQVSKMTSSSLNTSSGSGLKYTYPVKDDGGYLYKGIYRTAVNSKPEFLLSGPATNVAERLLGGRLSQERMLAGLLAGSSMSMVLNDYRRFSGEVPLSVRKEIRNETLQDVRSMLGLLGNKRKSR